MTFRPLFILAGVVLLMAVASGCENARTRAHDHAYAFAKLSTSDQRLVLRGNVRDGLNTEAVYIAWGDPDETLLLNTGKEAVQRWRYHRQITVTAPMGSSDQLAYGNSVFGMTVPLAVNAGFGFGGIGNEGALIYRPRLQIADATVKEADFRDGKLEHFRVYQGEFTLPR